MTAVALLGVVNIINDAIALPNPPVISSMNADSFSLSNNIFMTPTSPSQNPKQYTLDLENEGRLTLPEEVLRQLDLKQSDRLGMK